MYDNYILQNNNLDSDIFSSDSSNVSDSEEDSSSLLGSSDSVDYQPYFINIVDDLDLISSKYSDNETSVVAEDVTISDLNHTLQWTNTLFIVLILVIIGRSISNKVHLM